MTRFSIGLTTAFLLVACVASPSLLRIELVLANGRVIDPASGTDEVLNVGITGGKVVAMSAAPLDGDQVIDVTGLVVAPGFVDIHSHGLDPYTSSFQVRDGVTTALELEGGAFPMQEWYEEREGRWLTNFGASAGQGRVRRSILGDGSNRGALQPDQLRLLQEKISSAIDTGAIGIGLTPEYTPGASREEIYRMFELAAKRGVTVFIHVRSGVPDEPRHAVGAMQEALANAAVTGSSLHIVHVTSMALSHTPLVLEMIENAQGRGLDVTTEVYPYPAWATSIESALFEGDWQHDQSVTYQDLEWAATGERLTPETFQGISKPGWPGHRPRHPVGGRGNGGKTQGRHHRVGWNAARGRRAPPWGRYVCEGAGPIRPRRRFIDIDGRAQKDDASAGAGDWNRSSPPCGTRVVSRWARMPLSPSLTRLPSSIEPLSSRLHSPRTESDTYW